MRNDTFLDGKFRLLSIYGPLPTDAEEIRALHFRTGMVLWYNVKRGKEVLRYTTEDNTLWFNTECRFDLSDFWDEYDRERVRKEVWHSFEEEKDRQQKRHWLRLGYRPVCWAVPRWLGGI